MEMTRLRQGLLLLLRQCQPPGRSVFVVAYSSMQCVTFWIGGNISGIPLLWQSGTLLTRAFSNCCMSLLRIEPFSFSTAWLCCQVRAGPAGCDHYVLLTFLTSLCSLCAGFLLGRQAGTPSTHIRCGHSPQIPGSNSRRYKCAGMCAPICNTVEYSLCPQSSACWSFGEGRQPSLLTSTIDVHIDTLS